ncbi:Ldh family oxidoreductase [Falsiroseomonas selenitidurans]|uniref:Ldh family oxidoreductase n=1 Tax=Falsiroseomonas selenitidurans TaxID=2716335 RepID=A0ABX1E656_9PROT|nr:Ldh family oxidoreductase [Falsiroseomonas selenitidurans]NKC32451.1 Ldh family oxidoreductase [Falsiroseomonas selenitidurans]
MRASADSVRAQILAILAAWGMPEDLAAQTAEVMLDTDLAGVDSHGIGMLTSYEGMRRAGQVKLDARPRIERDGGAVALVDGGAGLGHPAAAFAMRLAIQRAKQFGVGAVAVRNSHHFGAAGWYVKLAAAEGCVGLVTSGTRTMAMVPTHGAVPVLGTNPIAFAAPAASQPPVVLDMATTTAAANKVRARALRNKPIPAGWVVDGRGQPVTEGAAAVAQIFEKPEGGLSPVGGTPDMASHKGYGLAMMAHILGATLSGASFSPIRVRTQRPEDPDDIGHFMLALNPAAFRPEGAFEQDLDAAVAVLRATPPADPALPVLVPGDPERAEHAERSAQGIPIPAGLEAQIRGICERAGIAFLLAEA